MNHLLWISISMVWKSSRGFFCSWQCVHRVVWKSSGCMDNSMGSVVCHFLIARSAGKEERRRPGSRKTEHLISRSINTRKERLLDSDRHHRRRLCNLISCLLVIQVYQAWRFFLIDLLLVAWSRGGRITRTVVETWVLWLLFMMLQKSLSVVVVLVINVCLFY